ncbi:hypothetical protein QBC33DRAFT_547685 [Phialemonium atrogriseum]|uniref:Secreted protein n=1 Tax=Phialemonium atrogriseum TaxID=1093897 RepID=A0AAJ0BWE0_9PEZI|nr:uncharacterized protein QBC33DRAFT_547685 [Phialemonium atrogriseum]KAK1764287.1 hypothetical protein QBC33DRAFT_547685 [Phialemonium atrogriseum]
MFLPCHDHRYCCCSLSLLLLLSIAVSVVAHRHCHRCPSLLLSPSIVIAIAAYHSYAVLVFIISPLGGGIRVLGSNERVSAVQLHTAIGVTLRANAKVGWGIRRLLLSPSRHCRHQCCQIVTLGFSSCTFPLSLGVDGCFFFRPFPCPQRAAAKANHHRASCPSGGLSAQIPCSLEIFLGSCNNAQVSRRMPRVAR